MRKAKKERSKLTNQLKEFVQGSAPCATELKYGGEGNEFIVTVFPVLPFTKRMEMVEEIADGTFVGDGNTINSYMPVYTTLLQKYTVVKYFTDLELPTSNLDELWLLLSYTPIYDDVVNAVGVCVIDGIFSEAEKAIGLRKQYLTTKTDISGLMDKIGGALKDFEERIPQEDIAAITSKIKDMPKGTSIQDIIGSLFGQKDVQG